MTPNPTMKGEKIYEHELDLTGVTDYGVSMDDLLTGREAIPLHGARFDLTVNGRFKGRLAGRAHGVDYLRVRADGRMELDLHLTASRYLTSCAGENGRVGSLRRGSHRNFVEPRLPPYGRATASSASSPEGQTRAE